jgi:hypothetical protein
MVRFLPMSVSRPAAAAPGARLKGRSLGCVPRRGGAVRFGLWGVRVPHVGVGPRRAEEGPDAA